MVASSCESMGGIKPTKFTSQTDGPIFKFHTEKIPKFAGKWEFLNSPGSNKIF